MGLPVVRRLRALAEGITRLKCRVADLSLDHALLKLLPPVHLAE